METIILNRFWENSSEKLPKRLFSSLTIPQILGCRFLNVLVLILGFLLYCFELLTNTEVDIGGFMHTYIVFSLWKSTLHNMAPSEGH